MRDPKRIPVLLEKLRTIWEAYPDLRLGQIVENAKSASKGNKIDTFSVEDDLLEEGLDWLTKLVKK